RGLPVVTRLQQKGPDRARAFTTTCHGIGLEYARSNKISYPDVPERVLVSMAVAVCTVNLYLHAKRFRCA
ncbi:MAG: hypothetical protein WCB12_15765, partial [Bryobacteraceae bacterium]